MDSYQITIQGRGEPFSADVSAEEATAAIVKLGLVEVDRVIIAINGAVQRSASPLEMNITLPGEIDEDPAE